MKTKRNLIQICLIGAIFLQITLLKAQPVVGIAQSQEDWHSLFIKNDGSLWVMGYNDYGQLGDGTYGTPLRPERILATGVKQVAAGRWYSILLKNDGSVWGMGNNSYGQLGSQISTTNKPTQIIASGVSSISAGGNHCLFLKNDSSLWAIGHKFIG